MADPVYELQQQVLGRLRSTPSVTTLVSSRIQDMPNPEWGELDYITIGASSYQSEDVDCIFGGEVMLQIDCWSVRGLVPVRTLADAVRRALRGWEPTLTTNALVTFDHWRTDYIRAAPIKQASIRYTAIIEDP